MRNLRNLQFSQQRQQNVTAVTWDPEKDEVICTIGPTEASSSIELARLSQDDPVSYRSVATWNAPSPNLDLPVDKIVNLQFLSGTDTTCIIFGGGDVVTLQELGSSKDDTHIEIAGSIDAGIAAAKWSPDEELLLVVTKANTVILMGSTFDPITETTLTAEDLNASKHVSVGWGKKETQFQGRGAKAMRDPTIPEKVDQGIPSAFEDGGAAISWRGDGAYVAVNSIVQGSRRAVRVYSRDGELVSATQPVDGLESSLSWRPAGNLIAGIQRRSDRVDVIFFERNGLRHGEFTLRSPGRDITADDDIRLEWNVDSTVLAVKLNDRVQLWTMGNYHWYLKQEILALPSCSLPAWHPEKPLRIAFATPAYITLAEYIFNTNRGSCQPPHDVGAVAVIDGETTKLTPLRTANIPPPMAMFELCAPAAVIDVAFTAHLEGIVVLHLQGIDVYAWSINSQPKAPELVSRVPFQFDLSSHTPSSLRLFYDSHESIRYVTYELGTGLVQRGMVTTTTQERGLIVLESNWPTPLVTVTHEHDSQSNTYGQDKTGRIFAMTSTGEVNADVWFSSLLPWFEVTKIDGAVIAFGLSRNGHLYANTRLITKTCTSFLLSPSHLIYTTNNHFIKFVHLTADINELDIPADDPEKDERCRSVERGSLIVTAIPKNMSVVLQMPRGNLETIYPRAMVVAGIRAVIDEKDYARAFSYCRSHRVDMNILYDHRPAQFLSNVGLFLNQLRDVSYIDLFLSSLREEDVTKTMYEDTKQLKLSSEVNGVASHLDALPMSTASATSKINTVCDAVLAALQHKKAFNLQNVITAMVCKSPPALDDGLLLVSDLMREDNSLAEKAIEHICFLVDVNRLYDHALGLYHLELTMLVAQQSQKDPREYGPFIQELHSLSDLRRKYCIDDYLGRRFKALNHLKSLDNFDELCDYTSKHNLHQEALKIYRYEAARLATLTAIYAAYLESQSAYREAGLAYESLQNYKKATSCYRAADASCWQECLYTAQSQIPALSEDAMQELATALADALWEAKDYAAAATIHQEYLSSIEQAVKCLCKGYHFAQAIRLVQRSSRPGLLESAVDVGLGEALGSTTEFLSDCKSQLLAQIPRILDLRCTATEDPLSFYEGERPGGVDIPDDISVAASSRLSTSASLFTRYTGKGAASVGTVGTGVSRATSKNRRREEKKRARGRKGTVYEEEYLVNSVRRLVERVEGAKPEVERLVFALVRRSMAERARAAQNLMAEVVEACKKAVEEIFPQPVQVGQDQGNDGPEAPWKATGGEAVLQEFAEAKTKLADAPLIQGMSKLDLLGS